jgi:hypothetical protein
VHGMNKTHIARTSDPTYDSMTPKIEKASIRGIA